jgi:hypothetical protein
MARRRRRWPPSAARGRRLSIRWRARARARVCVCVCVLTVVQFFHAILEDGKKYKDASYAEKIK